MPDYLIVVFGLTRQPERRVSLFRDLRIRHRLAPLGRFWRLETGRGRYRDSPIHQRRPWLELVKQRTLNLNDFVPILHRVGRYPSDLPDVDLAICNDVASRGRKVAIYPGADAVYGLTDLGPVFS